MSVIINARQCLTLVIAAGTAALMSACATTNAPVKVSKAAPITYKIDQGAVKSAALRTPNLPRGTSLPEARPTYTIPSPYTPQGRPAQRGSVSAPTTNHGVRFNPAEVDKDLYKHQKVGKRYTIMGESYTPKHQPNYNVVGLASWYGDKFHGKPTATGEIYNKNDITAAHKTLPLNSMLHVTNLENGRSLMVRLNDRGPFVGDRIIDLSEAAARALGTIEQGVGKVRVRYVGPADPMAPKRLVEAPKPRPVPAPSPQTVTPEPAPQAYQPLRLQDPIIGQAQRPVQPEPSPVNAPQEYAPYVPPVVPIEPKAAEPLMDTSPVPAEDDVITLTIKGPIHMAKSTSKKKAEWIPAVNYQRTAK